MDKEQALIKVDEQLEAHLQEIEKVATTITVVDNGSRVNAMELRRKITQAKKTVTEFFSKDKKEKKKAYDDVRNSEKHYLDALSRGLDHIDTTVLSYDDKVREEEKKERRRLQAEADKKARQERERLEKKASQLKTPERQADLLEQAEEVHAPSVVVESQIETVQGEVKKKHWYAKVTDFAALPDDWKIADQKALDAFARSTKGAKPVAGVEFKYKESLSTRG